MLISQQMANAQFQSTASRQKRFAQGQRFHYSRSMEKMRAIEALSALAQETRLDVFRLLVQAGPEGLSAGEILARIGGPANTLSSHLGVLGRAGLATSERRGRNIIYRPNFQHMSELLAFLLEDCCGGSRAVCLCGAREGRETLTGK